MKQATTEPIAMDARYRSGLPIVGTIKAQQDYTLNGESKPTQPGYKGYEHVTFLTPTDFDFESYHVANRVFKKVFGIFYDDVSR